MKNKIFALITVVCILAFTALPALAEQEQSVLYVGGVLVTDENANDVLGDGTVSYDAASKTLTFDGADITGAYEYYEKSFAVIYSTDDLNIHVKGRSKLTSPDSDLCTAGAYVCGNVCIDGTGVLEIVGGSVTNTNGNATESIGLAIDGDLTVDGADVQAFGGKVVSEGKGYACSIGISICGALVVKNGAALMGEAGETEGYYSYSCGMMCSYKNATVEGSYLSATGAKAVGVSAMSYAMCLDGVDLNVKGETSTVYFYTHEAVSTQKFSACSYGIYASGGDINITGGNVTVLLYESDDENSRYYGIQALTAVYPNGTTRGGNISVSAETVRVTENGRTFYGADLKVTVPEDGCAIYADGDITISDNLCIDDSENISIAEIKNKDSDLTYKTFADADGNDAAKVEIKLLTYRIRLENIKFTLGFDVPKGMSANEAYEVVDFSTDIPSQKQGYEIVGWYTDEECTDGNKYDFNSVVTSDITLYPKYAEIRDEPDVPPTGDSGIVALALLAAVAAAVVARKALKQI